MINCGRLNFPDLYMLLHVCQVDAKLLECYRNESHGAGGIVPVSADFTSLDEQSGIVGDWLASNAWQSVSVILAYRVGGVYWLLPWQRGSYRW
jgi:hypothetical protein